MTILPDDPNWDAQQLPASLHEIDNAEAAAEYKRVEQEPDSVARADKLREMEYSKAERGLNALDTPDAIRERVSRMTRLDLEEWRKEKGFGARVLLWQPLLVSTTRPDIVVEAMETQASQPAFAVDYGYAYHWSSFLVQRDHPEVYQWVPDNSGGFQEAGAFNRYEHSEDEQIITKLQEDLKRKARTALEMTADTIRLLKEDVRQWNHPPRK